MSELSQLVEAPGVPCKIRRDTLIEVNRWLASDRPSAICGMITAGANKHSAWAKLPPNVIEAIEAELLDLMGFREGTEITRQRISTDHLACLTPVETKLIWDRHVNTIRTPGIKFDSIASFRETHANLMEMGVHLVTDFVDKAQEKYEAKTSLRKPEKIMHASHQRQIEHFPDSFTDHPAVVPTPGKAHPEYGIYYSNARERHLRNDLPNHQADLSGGSPMQDTGLKLRQTGSYERIRPQQPSVMPISSFAYRPEIVDEYHKIKSRPPSTHIFRSPDIGLQTSKTKPQADMQPQKQQRDGAVDGNAIIQNPTQLREALVARFDKGADSYKRSPTTTVPSQKGQKHGKFVSRPTYPYPGQKKEPETIRTLPVSSPMQASTKAGRYAAYAHLNPRDIFSTRTENGIRDTDNATRPVAKSVQTGQAKYERLQRELDAEREQEKSLDDLENNGMKELEAELLRVRARNIKRKEAIENEKWFW